MLSEASDSRFVLTLVPRLAEALERLVETRFDAILLDLNLPDSSGLEAVRSINLVAPGVPVVVLSGWEDEALATRAVEVGAQDYLVKGRADGAGLARAIRYAIRRKLAEQYTSHLAYHDGLTNLPNRRLLLDRLSTALSRTRRNRRMLAVLFLDVDHFKHVNDTLGHAVGDQLLVAVAERLRRCMRDSDTVSRLSGDEFALVLPEIVRAEDVSGFAGKVLQGLRTPFWLEGHQVVVSASMGISLFPTDGEAPEALLKRADAAMYKTKARGGDSYQFYSSAANSAVSEHRLMVAGLSQALERGELVPHYQPIVDLKAHRITGFEALVRWQHPKLGLVPPLRFIPIAEQTGLIGPIGQWMLESACSQARAWRDAGFPHLSMAVNLSNHQLKSGRLHEVVSRVVKGNGGASGQLELEFTEGDLMRTPEVSIDLLRRLGAVGARIAVDDFGTGFGSLERLGRFPIHILKIDRPFVRDCAAASRRSIIPSIIDMAHALRLEVTAEGVESARQATYLSRHHCDRAQGVYFSAAMPADRATALLQEGPLRSG